MSIKKSVIHINSFNFCSLCNQTHTHVLMSYLTLDMFERFGTKNYKKNYCLDGFCSLAQYSNCTFVYAINIRSWNKRIGEKGR